jgi:hypothetical protein
MTAGEGLTPNPSPKERGTKNSNIIEYVIPTEEVSRFLSKAIGKRCLPRRNDNRGMINVK